MAEYKRLGDYIREVNVRNRELKVTNLLGLSVSKEFMPSIANTIGTDMSTYKVVERNQLVYIADTSRRGDKIAIGLLDKYDNAIVSQAYTVFEVIDHEQLLPEYLMMWFRRPEFDRYARFHSHGSAREIFDWDELCDVMLPIPSITRQREIVSEYETLTNRIRLNNQMIQHLEATAQVLYRKTSVDNIDKENLPKGWRMGTLGDYVELSQGIQVEVEDQSPIKHNGYNRFIRIIDYTPNTSEPPRYVNISNERYFSTRGDVIMIRYGDAGTVCRRLEGIIANNLFKITPIKTLTRNYVYHFLKSDTIQKLIKGSAASSTMPAITHKAVKDLECIIPPISVVQEFDTIINIIEKDICLKSDEISKLTELQSLLLAKMGQ
ncbi:MAG: restriction endonuclease subunit S [Prevotella sp.]|nr:restriction endonuclease subunit S [Prevotella sp.]